MDPQRVGFLKAGWPGGVSFLLSFTLDAVTIWSCPHILIAYEREGQPKRSVGMGAGTYGVMLLSMKTATRDRPRGLGRAGTAFQPDPLTRQALMLTSRSPLKVGTEAGSKNGRNVGTQQGVPESGSQGGPGMGQEPGQPQTGDTATSSHPAPHPALPGPPHTLSGHTHLAEKEEAGPMCDPGIRVQPLHPLQAIPHRSRWKGEDLNNH